MGLKHIQWLMLSKLVVAAIPALGSMTILAHNRPARVESLGALGALSPACPRTLVYHALALPPVSDMEGPASI